MELQEWLERERAGGTVESSGHFTVDAARARVKLSRFQLQKGLYLAKLIQAGVAAGCSRIDIDLSGDVTLRYEAVDLAKVNLNELLCGLEEPQSLPPDSACACLVTGMLAAQGDAGRTVIWHCSDGARVVIEPGGEVRVSQGQVDPARWAILLIRSVGDCGVERKVLSERCGYCPIPVRVNGELLEQGWLGELRDELSPVFRLAEKYWAGSAGPLRLPGPDPERAFLHGREGSGPWDCAVAISSSLEGPAQVRWVRLGVVVASGELTGACPGSMVVVGAPELSLDLSQFQFIQDEKYRELRDTIFQRVGSVLADLKVPGRPLKVPPRRGVLEGAVVTGMQAIGASLLLAVLSPALAPFAILVGSVGSLVTSTGYYYYKEGRSDAAEEKRVRERLKGLKVPPKLGTVALGESP